MVRLGNCLRPIPIRTAKVLYLLLAPGALVSRRIPSGSYQQLLSRRLAPFHQIRLMAAPRPVERARLGADKELDEPVHGLMERIVFACSGDSEAKITNS